MLKYKLAGLVAIVAVLAILGVRWAGQNVGPSAQSAELVAAIHHAQSTLHTFRDRLERPGPGDRSFFFRGSFTSPKGRKAMLWLKHAEVAANGFKGVIDEDPFDLNGIRRGDQVTVASDDVVDWTIVHQDGTREGAFTQGLEPGH